MCVCSVLIFTWKVKWMSSYVVKEITEVTIAEIEHLINIVKSNFVPILGFHFKVDRWHHLHVCQYSLGSSNNFALHCNCLIRGSSIKLCKALKAFSCFIKLILNMRLHVFLMNHYSRWFTTFTFSPLRKEAITLIKAIADK